MSASRKRIAACHAVAHRSAKWQDGVTGSEKYSFVVGRETRAEYDSELDLERLYASGLDLDSKVAAFAEAGADAAAEYYLKDSVNTTRGLAGDNGKSSGYVHRTAFGTVVMDTTDGFLPQGFQGLPTDSESGLVAVRQRMYDPRAGRFIQRDPVVANHIGEAYVFAGNQPHMRVDPLGLDDSATVRRFEQLLKNHPAFKEFQRAIRARPGRVQ